MGIIDPLKHAQRQKAKKRFQRRAKRLRRGPKPPKYACHVYALKDGDGRVVYVGQTRSELSRRMMFHRKSASPTGSPIERWLHYNKATIHMLDSDGIWDVSEVIWIERMKVAGEVLLNANLGGRDTRARI